MAREDVRAVAIEIFSSIDGCESIIKTTGEYKYVEDEDKHVVVFTDYTGNIITKNGLEICTDKLFLHRTGGFNGDMLFDLNTDTVMKYSAYMVSSDFLIHTNRYEVSKDKNQLMVKVDYLLRDVTGKAEDITARQIITIMGL